MRKTVQEKVEAITCDSCEAEIGSRIPISLDAYRKSSWEEDYQFCSAKCLLDWLCSCKVDTPFDFHWDICDIYDYSIHMSGECMLDLVRLLKGAKYGNIK